MSKNQPIDKIRFGRLAVTIRENTFQEGNALRIGPDICLMEKTIMNNISVNVRHCTA